MALDFPSNPQTNDVYTYNSKSWVWNGSIWKALNQGIQGTQGIQGAQGIQGVTGIQGAQGIQGLKGTKVTASDTAPLSPSINDFWWDSQTGDLMVYYDDGNTQQWVGATSGITGIQGTQGTQGIQGIQGTLGSAGPSTVLNATNDTSSITLYPVMLNAAGSDQTPKVTTGSLTFNAATGTLSTTNLTTSGSISLNGGSFYYPENGSIYFRAGGGATHIMYNNGLISYAGILDFGHTGGNYAKTSIIAGEDVTGTAGTFEFRTGANGSSGAQAHRLRIYKTFTSYTNFERLSLDWQSNTAYIYTEKGSAGGTSRDLVLGTNATTAITIDATTQNVTIAKKLNTAASTTSAASVNVPHGTAPTSPVDGDMWTTSAGLYVRVNGVTVGPLGAGSASGFETSFLLMGA